MNWTDPTVWSMIIAGIALVLSQFPPLRELFSRARVKINAPELFQLYHFFGNTHLVMFLDIHNAGGRTTVIERVLCFISDENNSVWTLPAQSYISRQLTDQNSGTLPEFPVGRIVLESGDRWYERTHFYRFWTETQEEKSNDIILDIRNDITSRFPDPDGKWIEAEPNLVQKATDFFEQNFSLHKGNYNLIIVALSEDNIPISLRGYDFTLYESHIRALRSHIEDYKYGEGIYFPVRDPMKYLWIRVKPMNDEKRVEKIFSKLKSKID